MSLFQADEPTDAELVQQAPEDQAAFAALYRRYLTPVYRYFYARTGDVQQAEDLTAQNFVAMLEGLPATANAGSLLAGCSPSPRVAWPITSAVAGRPWPWTTLPTYPIPTRRRKSWPNARTRRRVWGRHCGPSHPTGRRPWPCTSSVS